MGPQTWTAVALAGLMLVAGCAQGAVGPGSAENACAARGLTPGTADFYACLHPNEAAVIDEGENAWQQMDNGEE